MGRFWTVRTAPGLPRCRRSAVAAESAWGRGRSSQVRNRRPVDQPGGCPLWNMVRHGYRGRQRGSTSASAAPKAPTPPRRRSLAEREERTENRRQQPGSQAGWRPRQRELAAGSGRYVDGEQTRRASAHRQWCAVERCGVAGPCQSSEGESAAGAVLDVQLFRAIRGDVVVDERALRCLGQTAVGLGQGLGRAQHGDDVAVATPTGRRSTRPLREVVLDRDGVQPQRWSAVAIRAAAPDRVESLGARRPVVGQHSLSLNA